MALRGLTSQVKAEIAKRAVRIYHLVELDFGATVLRMTTCFRPITHLGDVYGAGGSLVDIGNAAESMAINVNSISIALSGVKQANIAVALTVNYIDSPVKIYRLFLDAAGTVIPDPYIYFEGAVTEFNVSEDPDAGTSTVSWAAASHWSDFERTAGRRTNDNDQEAIHAGDRGFEFSVVALNDIKWGRA